MHLRGLIMIPLGLVDGACGCPPSFLVLDLGLAASLSQTEGGDGLLLGRWTEGGNQSGDCRDLGPLWDDATRGYWIVTFCHRALDNTGRCRPPKIYLGDPNACVGCWGSTCVDVETRGAIGEKGWTESWTPPRQPACDAPRRAVMHQRRKPWLVMRAYAPTTHSFHTPVGFFLRMAHSSLNVVQVKRSSSVPPGARCQAVS